MIYDPHSATVSRAEIDRLMAVVRAPPDAGKTLTEEDRWRRDYQAEQERRRVVGYALKRAAGSSPCGSMNSRDDLA